jgi:MFS family permease
MTAAERRLFYGWRIVAASFVILFITVGVGIYAPPVFLIPLQEHFGWSRAAIAAGPGIAALMSGLLSPLVGAWIDRYGARRVMSIGAAVMGGAFLLLGFVNALWQFYAVNAIAAVGVTCVAWIPTQTLISTWFERRRGLAMGITLAGIGFGGLAIAPLGSALIGWAGWRIAYATLGSMILLIVVTLAVTVVRSRPADLGLLPDGDPVASPGTAPAPDQATEAAEELPGLELAGAFKTSALWMLVVCHFLWVFAGLSIVAHVHAFLTDEGFSSDAAAWALGLAIGVSVVGRVLFGLLADALPKKYVLALAFVVEAAAPLALLSIHWVGALPAFVIAFGLGIGGGAVLVPLLVGDCFGLRSFGKILGVVMIPGALGAAIGPVLTGRIFDVTGSYALGFALHLAAFLIAAALICFLRRPAFDRISTQGGLP